MEIEQDDSIFSKDCFFGEKENIDRFLVKDDVLVLPIDLTIFQAFLWSLEYSNASVYIIFTLFTPRNSSESLFYPKQNITTYFCLC